MMYARFFKRFFDFCLSFIALAVFWPLLAVLAVVVAIAMKGNPFFVQPRPGKVGRRTGRERIFKLVKFRTMTQAKDKEGRLLPDAERLTRFGELMRSLSLDELPELWNILKGDMAIVGPRPLLVRDMVFMSSEQRRRHLVRPGLTGLAQISGRNNISWERKLSCDLEYIERLSLRGDIGIILRTVAKVFKRSDVVREGTASDMDYGDWLLSQGMTTEAEHSARLEEAKTILEEWSKRRDTIRRSATK